jgi:spore germination protein YaaH
MLMVYVSVPALATITPTNIAYGSWLPYWETSASLEEANEMQNQLDTFVAFACLFDNKDNLLMPVETVDLLSALKKSHAQDGKNVYLSVVNDIEVSPGKYDNKSVGLLRRLFRSEETRSRHMEQLAELIDTYGLKGLELDYENIKYDTGLWSSYTLFIEKIWSICQRDGINLRIVLPWDAPLYANLPVGPEYTVMCYNLYGYHSGPGPKADLAFLKKTCELYVNAPFTVRMAFATGGFDWYDGTIDALTQEQAQKQLQAVQFEPSRDEASGALTAAYKQDGKEHTMWYADAKTLCVWQDVCASYGFSSFDLFRLGGNDVENLKSILFDTTP